MTQPTNAPNLTTAAHHYLVVRPLASSPAGLEDRLGTLAELTGLDGYTVRQKLVGTALETLATDTDRGALQHTSRVLRQQGVSAWVVTKTEITRGEPAQRCTSLEFRDDAIHFVAPDGRRSATLRRGDRCLLVLGALDFRSFQQKLMARRALQVTGSLALDEVLRSVFANDPVLDVYLPGSAIAVRIHGRRFDFTCLGERNRLAVGTNFPTVLDDLREVAGEATLDTSFGVIQHPFLHWPDPYDPGLMLRQFQLYSRFLYRSFLEDKPEAEKRTEGPLSPLAPLAALDPSGVLWTTVTPHRAAAAGVRGGSPPAPETTPPALPPPPVAPSSFTPSSPLSWVRLLDRSAGWYRQLARSLGAPVLVQPLLAVALGAFGVSWAVESTRPLALGVMLLGAASFTHAFVLVLRKRTIQNCPTARLRSLPMGEVEVTGRAAQKYFLKSPYTLTDCVYYSYEVYVRSTGRGQAGYTVRESGHSGRIPFYLQEGPHRVLVCPEKAVLHAGTAQTLYSSGLGSLGLGLGRAVPADGKVVERVIATGDQLYVMGCARRVRHSAHEYRQRFHDKLRELKANRKRMRRYDLDGDGRIDAEEWAMARGEVEETTLLESLTGPTERDEVAIGEHPAGGLFYISDRKEEAILHSLTWKIPLSFAVGAAGIIGGGYTLAQLLTRAGAG